ncbi:unannotated protein [freshwater metagenome]|uniref:Unannotated protein n=1 Tax=freshwater metagenome TaxID=449393 RepID=A0A6J6EGZ3_9ZZZZ
MLITRASRPPEIMPGRNALVISIGAMALTRMVRSMPRSGSWSTNSAPVTTPALLISTSMPPWARVTSAEALSTALASEMSTVMGTSFCSLVSDGESSLTVAASCFAFTSQRTITAAPSAIARST